MEQIVAMLTKNLCTRCEKQLSIELSVTPAVREYLVKKYTDLKMGARPLRRAIQTQLEDPLAEEILAGNVKPGDKVSASLRDKKIVFLVKNTVEKELVRDSNSQNVNTNYSLYTEKTNGNVGLFYCFYVK